MPFNTRNLSICKFWDPQVSWSQHLLEVKEDCTNSLELTEDTVILSMMKTHIFYSELEGVLPREKMFERPNKYRSMAFERMHFTSALPSPRTQRATSKYSRINFMVVSWDLETENGHPGEGAGPLAFLFAALLYPPRARPPIMAHVWSVWWRQGERK